MDGQMTLAGRAPTPDKAADEEAAREVLTSKSILGVPWIDPAEMAPVVVFLASDAAEWFQAQPTM